MDPALEQQDFSPPRQRRVILRGLPIAIVAHVLFVLALAWSLDWKREDPAMAAIPLPPPAGASADPTQSMGAPPAPSPAPEAAKPSRKETSSRSR